jgi:hypothetical protein
LIIKYLKKKKKKFPITQHSTHNFYSVLFVLMQFSYYHKYEKNSQFLQLIFMARNIPKTNILFQTLASCSHCERTFNDPTFKNRERTFKNSSEHSRVYIPNRRPKAYKQRLNRLIKVILKGHISKYTYYI